MKSSFSPILIALAISGAAVLTAPAWGQAAPPGHVTIQADKPGAKISPTLYGLMTEEINYSYDGGLYGELIQNRTFQDSPIVPNANNNRATILPFDANKPPHWSLYTLGQSAGTLQVDTKDPVNAVGLKNSLRLDITKCADNQFVGVTNDGYWGIPARPNTTYQASFYAKSSDGFKGKLHVGIVGAADKLYASSDIDVSGKWGLHKVTLKTGTDFSATADAKFLLASNTPGSLFFSQVSLFPPTFKTRDAAALGSRPVTGFRSDIMQLLDEMHPTFLRFPGGNYVEGQNFANRFNWKETIGPWEERPGHLSPWTYRSSDGMGVLEFLEWCEDLKMTPVLAVYAGYNLDRTTVPAEDYPKYAQEAVEEIEYVTGDKTTEWGAKRAKDGHPEPFKVTYVEIGNEDNLGGGGATYSARFTVFANAIRAKYGDKFKLISSAGTNRINGAVADLQDEHHYPTSMSASLALANSFDGRARNGPHVFVGEWATRIGNVQTPSFSCALCDAAFMCGVERNSDLVEMFCYAPLLVNVNPRVLPSDPGGMQWATDMIGYNALNSFASPAYYVEKMFYNNKGDTVLPIANLTPQTTLAPLPVPPGRNGAPAGPPPVLPPVFASASRDESNGDIIFKVVNSREAAQTLEVTIAGADTINKNATGEVYTGELTAVNTIAAPMACIPKPLTVTDASNKWTHEFPASSITVVHFRTK